ncbi:MAG: hypothetical protein J1G38_01525 [Clostridiales bacterium]|nr:hypothetical protein [Clostridiales bacterium]
MERKMRKSSLVAILLVAVLAFFGSMIAVFGRFAVRASAEDHADLYNDAAGGIAPYAAGNKLVDSEGGDYSVPNHAYGGETAVTAPELLHGGDGGEMTFKLYYNEEQIGAEEGFGVDSFDYYINSAMPVGSYRLEVEVGAVTTEGEDEAEGDTYDAFSDTLTFEVSEGTLPSLDELNDVLDGKMFESAGYSHVIYDDPDEVISAYIDNLNGLRNGTIWGDVLDYSDRFLGTCEMLYDLDGDDEEVGYMTVDLLAVALAAAENTYTVRYKVVAKNYADATADFAGKSFEVLRYRVLQIPSVEEGLVYTGSVLYPELTTDELDVEGLYTADWGAAIDRVDAGEHSVIVTLAKPLYYRWAGYEDDKTGEIEVFYHIAQAENRFISRPYIAGWDYGFYDKEVYSIRVAALYNNENIRFRITKMGDVNVVPGLDNFTVDVANGIVSDEIAELLNGLTAGRYILYAYIPELKNFSSLTEQAEFVVAQAQNEWGGKDGDLVLPSWTEGQFNEGLHRFVVHAKYGEVNIKITDINGKEYYNSVTGKNKLNDCAAGKYLLKAWVDGTENYTKLDERTFTLQVFEKPGIPWWVSLVIALSIVLVVALVIFILWKKDVFQILTEKVAVAIRTKASVEATIAAARAQKMAEEGRESIEAAKRRERLEKMRKKAEEKRKMSPEERAAELEAKAEAAEARAEKLRAQSEKNKAKAAKMRENTPKKEDEPKAEDVKEEAQTAEAPTNEAPTTEAPEKEAAATETPETPTEE